MTFSILAAEPATGSIGGAAATGNLCVGGWVLRGNAQVGMSASQGTAPSTLWGEQVLRAMSDGTQVEQAVEITVAADVGRVQRQLVALDLRGCSGAFTGTDNGPAMGSRTFHGGIVAGNQLASTAVLDAMASAFNAAEPSALGERLLWALRAAQQIGGDRRGLMSAAILVFSPDHPPLDLRVDYHETPVEALESLHRRATSGSYQEWTRCVPTCNDPYRVMNPSDLADVLVTNPTGRR